MTIVARPLRGRAALGDGGGPAPGTPLEPGVARRTIEPRPAERGWGNTAGCSAAGSRPSCAAPSRCAGRGLSVSFQETPGSARAIVAVLRWRGVTRGFYANAARTRLRSGLFRSRRVRQTLARPCLRRDRRALRSLRPRPLMSHLLDSTLISVSKRTSRWRFQTATESRTAPRCISLCGEVSLPTAPRGAGPLLDN